MSVEATVLIPTHNHGPTLRASLQSALAQSVPVEVFVIGDGISEETRAVVEDIVREHPCVRFFDYPMGPRHGEAYRHDALTHANGPVVCYLSDDDVYLPHHVADMCKLLEDADFAHAQAVEALVGGGIGVWTVDLALSAYRRESLRGSNRIPFSAGAHTLSAYRALPEGWTSAPQGIPTDLFMWQKFIRQPDCRFRSGWRPSVLIFPSPKRLDMPLEERRMEMESWIARTRGEQGVIALNAEVLSAKTASLAELEARFIDATLDDGKLRSGHVFQVFFPHPQEYDEKDSARFQVHGGEWETIRVRFPYPTSGLSVRIDPTDRPCVIELGRIVLRASDRSVLWRLDKDNCQEVRIGGTAVELSRGQVLTLLSDGNDPQVRLPPLRLPCEPEEVELEVVVRLDADTERIARLFSDRLRLQSA